MPQTPRDESRSDFLGIVLRGWWAIVLCMVVAALAAYVTAKGAAPTYTAATTSIVAPAPSIESDSALISSVQGLDKRSIVSTYAEILLSNSILRQASEAVGITNRAAYEVDATVLLDSNVLELTVDGPDAVKAAALANMVVSMSADSFESLYPVYAVSTLDPAVVPDEPSEPQPARDAIAAAALGLILGVGVAALLEVRRKRLGHGDFELEEIDIAGLEDELARKAATRAKPLTRDRAD